MTKTDPIIVPDSEVTPEIPSTISINGVDYDPTEAQSYIELGKKTKELETQWDTPVDKVWPEYGKTRESLKTMETELNEARSQLQEFQNKKEAGTETTTDIKEAQEAARKLGLILNEDLDKAGYIKKEDLPGLFQTYTQEQEAVKSVLDTANSLETEINGSDGRPAFNKKIVLAYASAYNIPDLKAAYEDMHKPQLDAWKTTQIKSKENKGLKTLDASGAKGDPIAPKVNDDNLSDRLTEALYGSTE